MKAILVLASLLLYSLAPTSSYAQTGEGVTLSELEGATITAGVVREQLLDRQGQQFSNRFENKLKLVIGPTKKVEGTEEITLRSRFGVHKGKPAPILGTLERPGEISRYGHGHRVWFFSEGRLTHLRTFTRGGAFRREIAFTRSSGGLTCTITEDFAREGGVGEIVTDSAVDGVPLKIISYKQLSSNCRVEKPK